MTSSEPSAVAASASPMPALRRSAAALLLAQFACMWAAFLILMPAINWPASLDEPASVVLPLILQKSGAVFAGYSSYLLHALALIPLAITLRVALRMSPALGALAASLGVLAGLAKALGIVRWLFLMPGLAAAYVDPAASAATKAAIETLYLAFNAYAGGVGELLGVALFTGLWSLCVALALLRLGARKFALSGLVAAAGLLATLASIVGLESPLLLTVSGIVWQLWAAALAIWCIRNAKEGAA